MTPDAVARHFTRSDGTYLFARWRRPVVPVVFGAGAGSLPAFKGAFAAVCALAGHPMAETDAELGANVMIFVVRDWAELRDLPGLDRLVVGLRDLLERLEAAGANQYRVFRFEADGAIRAAVVLLRMDAHLAAMPADVLALAQAVQTILLWSDTAFDGGSPLAQVAGQVILRPDVGALIRAGYDPVLPPMTREPAHALRLAARVGAVQ